MVSGLKTNTMKGICFKEPLFHATVRGSKTQTRRIMKPQPDDGQIWSSILGLEMKPRYKKGELLYLKEPYIDDLSMDKTFYKFDKADFLEVQYKASHLFGTGVPPTLWKNKLFMPQSAARYFIKITDVRFERLQEITEEDCIKEGIEMNNIPFEGWYWMKGYYSTDSPILAYERLIDQINGKGTWDSNPFVFVYDYELTTLV